MRRTAASRSLEACRSRLGKVVQGLLVAGKPTGLARRRAALAQPWSEGFPGEVAIGIAHNDWRERAHHAGDGRGQGGRPTDRESEYAHVAPLRNPKNDVELLAKVMQSIPRSHVIATTDGTKKAMDDSIAEFLAELGPGVVAIFVFAGQCVTRCQ